MVFILVNMLQCRLVNAVKS